MRYAVFLTTTKLAHKTT